MKLDVVSILVLAVAIAAGVMLANWASKTLFKA